MKNILELLETNAEKWPDKTSFADTENSDSYSALLICAKSIGTAIQKKGIYKKAIAVYMNQSVQSIEAMLGIVYSGNYYVVIDGKMPQNRIEYIFSIVRPSLTICDDEHYGFTSNFSVKCNNITELKTVKPDESIIKKIRQKQIDTDPVYVLFTSGSTGVPKGTVINHRNILAYSKWLCDTFDINSHTVYGNQTPFYFSMSVSDVYGTLRSGATLNIIPKKYFSFPVQLINYLNKRHVNTIYWVPSALAIIANWKALDAVKLEHIEKVMFAGESISVKHLNYWRQHIPDAMYANLFGPTETTDICAYWIQNRELKDTERVPIGKACDNCECLIIDENGNETDEGELFVRGSFLSYGYFGNAEKTKNAFVQNPLHNNFPEKVYRTGDIVKLNKFGEMEYISRKDSQIKHLGYRIELGEIEAASNLHEKVKNSCAIYDDPEDKIVLIYEGTKIDVKDFFVFLSKYLPTYMIPSEIKRIKNMPYNANGKIDRLWLKNNYYNI